MQSGEVVCVFATVKWRIQVLVMCAVALCVRERDFLVTVTLLLCGIAHVYVCLTIEVTEVNHVSGLSSRQLYC